MIHIGWPGRRFLAVLAALVMLAPVLASGDGGTGVSTASGDTGSSTAPDTSASSVSALARDTTLNESRRDAEPLIGKAEMDGSTIRLVEPAPLDTVPFGVGERLRYHMDFSFVRAGWSEMSILGIDSSMGKPAFHFRSRVRSTPTVDFFYKVRDQVDSWFDVRSLYSYRYERRIHEGGYRSRKYYDYNNRTGWIAISNENGPKGITPFIPFSHNIISALYWVRSQPLQKGHDLTLPLHDMNVEYILTVKVYGKEKVKVPAGTFTCWKVEPVIESEGLFKMAGRLWVWITDDEHRLPVLMKSEIPVGTIDGKLVDFRLGKAFKPGEKTPDFKVDDEWDW